MIALTGLGLWAPGFDGLAAWRAGVPDEAVTLPRCDVADARAKRGTSRIARMLGEVVTQAAAHARVDLGTTPTVYASAWGEIDVMVGLLAQIADGEAGLSPLRFKHSVHNASAGLVSIATGNTGFSTSLAAGRRTFEMALLEAVAHLESGQSERVLYAVGEDRLPEPLAQQSEHEALAVGLCLEHASAGAGRALAWLTLEPGAAADAAAEEALAPVPPRFRDNPAAWALPLVQASLDGAACVLATSPGPRPLRLRVRPPSPEDGA